MTDIKTLETINMWSCDIYMIDGSYSIEDRILDFQRRPLKYSPCRCDDPTHLIAVKSPSGWWVERPDRYLLIDVVTAEVVNTRRRSGHPVVPEPD